MVKTKPFDAAEVLDSPEMIAAYLTEGFGSDDPALMAKPLKLTCLDSSGCLSE